MGIGRVLLQVENHAQPDDARLLWPVPPFAGLNRPSHRQRELDGLSLSGCSGATCQQSVEDVQIQEIERLNHDISRQMIAVATHRRCCACWPFVLPQRQPRHLPQQCICAAKRRAAMPRPGTLPDPAFLCARLQRTRCLGNNGLPPEPRVRRRGEVPFGSFPISFGGI